MQLREVYCYANTAIAATRLIARQKRSDGDPREKLAIPYERGVEKTRIYIMRLSDSETIPKTQ